MIIKCPNCGAAVEFDPVSGKMKCAYCESIFEMGELTPEEETKQDVTQEPAQDRMECNIYSCKSCGAELAVNGVEASTFCAYCGQATIVFDRVSHELKPELIIPFKVQKDQAINAIRERFATGRFVPNEVKNFDVERVCGIYIPYWLFDTYYYDRQIIKATIRNNDKSQTVHYYREAECNFNNLTLDASRNLNDDSSQRLEPYNMQELRSFDVGYMSGYYADRYDMKNTDLRNLAYSRTKELFDTEVLSTCSGSGKTIVSNAPKMSINKETYAMLPAWFMTFRYNNQPYTMLINGQTGKLVGAVPFESRKAWKSGILTFFICALICIPLAITMLLNSLYSGENTFELIGGMIIVSIITMVVGFITLGKIKHSTQLTSSQEMNKFAHDRQEG